MRPTSPAVAALAALILAQTACSNSSSTASSPDGSSPGSGADGSGGGGDDGAGGSVDGTGGGDDGAGGSADGSGGGGDDGAGGSVDGGTEGGDGGGRDGGTDSGGGTDAGKDGGHDAGVGGGHDAGVDGGHDAGVGGGHDAGAADSGVDAGPVVGASVLQFHNHINRDGFYIDNAITETTATTFARDTSFNGAVTGNVYASPLYVQNGVGGKGTFYLATEAGTIFALDETTGAVVWQKNVVTPPDNTGAGCGNISPIGITGTPAIDLATRLIVFNSATADGGNNIGTHMIYALSIDTGTEAWHVDASTMTSGGTTFSPQPQNQRGAVLIVNGIAYVPYGGHYGDCGTYHGWVIGVPLSGKGAKAWATQTGGAGIWGCGGPASDGQSIYVTTGNGINGPASWAESEGLFRLDPGPTFTQTAPDYFAPYDWQQLDQGDVDLSGSGPMVIDAPSMTPSKLVLAQGKDGYLYLVDRTNLGGIATSSQLANVGALKVQSGEISNGGAWATVGGTTYVVVRPNGQDAAIGCPAGTSGDLVAVKLDPTAAQKMTVAWCATSNGVGSPMITTSDGTKDPMVWAFSADQGANVQLYSWDLTTGAAVYTGGAATDTAPNVRRFTTPIAVHGRILIGGDGKLYAYKGK